MLTNKYHGQEKIEECLYAGEVLRAKNLAYEWLITQLWSKKEFFTFLDSLEAYTHPQQNKE